MCIANDWSARLNVSFGLVLLPKRNATAARKRRRRSHGMIEPLERRVLLSTITVNAAGGADYTDLGNALDAANNGDTITVAPGHYTAHATVDDPSASIYFVNKSLTIESTAGAASTTLSIPSGQNVGVWITASNVTITGFTVNGGYFGVQATAQNSSTLSNLVLSNLIVHPDTTGANGHGIYYYDVANSVIEGCTVGPSIDNGIFLDGGSTNDLVKDNTVNGTLVQHAIAVKDSNYNQVLDNTVTSSAFDGIILVGASYNRLEFNNISGQKVDGITLTRYLVGNVTYDSQFNYIAENTVVSTGEAQGLTSGTGIWLDSEADGNTVFANTVSGSPETGIAIFLSSDNLIQANTIFNEYEGGILVWNIPGNLTNSVGNPPNNNVLTGNYIHNCPNNGMIDLRGASNTQIANNVITGNYTVAGSSTDGGITVQTSSNTTIYSNTILNVWSTYYIYSDSTNTNIYQNRSINCGQNFAFPPATVNWDGGSVLGGNYWSGFAANGNPSSGTPYTNIIVNQSTGATGGYVDNYPYQSESLGQPYTASISSPIGGATVAAGSVQTIAWQSTAAVYVDLYYQSAQTGNVLIASNVPNTGFYSWTLPSSLPAGSDYVVQVTPKNSARTAQGAAVSSAAFTVSPAELNLLMPGDRARANAGSTIQVAWQDTAANTPVNVQIQLNGGAWQTLASNVTTDYTTVTLPNSASNQARVRVVAANNGDTSTQDGYFNLQSTAAVTSNPNGSPLQIGSTQLLTWTSPANSQTVTIALWTGSTWQAVVSGLPDNGAYAWFVPDQPVATNSAQIYVTYYDASGTQITQAGSKPFSILTIVHGTTSIGGTIYTDTNDSGVWNSADPGLNDVMVYLDTNHNGRLDGGEISVNTDANGNYLFSNLAAGTYTVREVVPGGYVQTSPAAGFINATVASNQVVSGQTFLDAATGNAAAKAVYRLYSPVTLEHLYTTDPNEYNTLESYVGTWNGEGQVFSEYSGPATVGGVADEPFYRLYNPSVLQHLWTTDLNEYTVLATEGWTQEGIVGYVFPATPGSTATALPAVPNSQALYRLMAPQVHLWTTNVTEYDTLATEGWTQEGIIGYVLAA